VHRVITMHARRRQTDGQTDERRGNSAKNSNRQRRYFYIGEELKG